MTLTSLENLEAMGMKEVSASVRPQIEDLLKIQSKHDSIQAEFNRKVLQLELEYETKYAPLYTDRSKIIKGTEAEQGIPGFWLTALKNNFMIGEMITEADETALSSLVNVTSSRLEDNHSFKLEFEFAKNSFFTNPVLSKIFHFVKVECGNDSQCCASDNTAACTTEEQYESLYRFDRMEGTTIDWLPGSNLTVKIVKKTQRHKTKNITRVVEREENVDSFFNFFSTPSTHASCSNDEDEDVSSSHEHDIDDEVAAHLEMGDLIRTKIIPDAVNWYLGIAEDDTAPFEDEDDLENYSDDSDDENEDSDNNSDDEHVESSKSNRSVARPRKSSQDCKQQ